MIFSIYVLRGDPEHVLFDRDLVDAEVSMNAFDCAGVFEVEGEGVHRVEAAFYWRQDGSCHLGVIDEWRLSARSVLRGDFTDKASGNTAKITRLWPVIH